MCLKSNETAHNSFTLYAQCKLQSNDCFELKEYEKSLGVRSGEYGCCSSVAMLFMTKDFRMFEALCARALSW